jgi:predicted NUDIX family NTP pyrophosphohydrolase
MAATRSAGVLLYRDRASGLEVLIAHMGGPFWARKDAGAWSIPKGEYDSEESPLAAARREFAEELGAPVPDGDVSDLGEVTQSGGKVVTAFAVRGELDTTEVISNTFTMEWPPGSGKFAEFAEIDRAEWCDIATARARLVAGQRPLLDRLLKAIGQAT